MTATFWIAGVIAVLGAFGLVLFRKAVYAALSTGVTMVSLGVLYVSLDAPFLFAAQIIVYTGAILMMFLFVMMLVGIDRMESTVETIRGQRAGAVAGVTAMAVLLILAIHGSVMNQAPAPAGELPSNPVQLAEVIFGRYVFVFELVTALLITAAIGAMVLAHRTRTRAKKGQAELADDRMRAYAETGKHPGARPNSGVFARSNAIGTPALLPDGSIAPDSVSRTLLIRGATVEPADLLAQTSETFAAIEAVHAADEEDDE